MHKHKITIQAPKPKPKEVMDVLRSTENVRRTNSSTNLHINTNTNLNLAAKYAAISPRATTTTTTTTTTPRSMTTPRTTPKSSPTKPDELECNYDINPSKLYLTIQRKKWDEATSRATAHPLECQTWVSRSEDNGTLRWRLLPLHAAIIFKAPEKVIHALLLSYPHACHKKDDQGMLPIHSAVRNESPVAVVQFLLLAFPKCMKVTDRKGRLPFVMVQNSRSALKHRYMECLNHTELYHSVAKASCESDSLINVRKQNAVGGGNNNNGNAEFDVLEKINLMAKVDALDQDLIQTQGASEILVNHINTLEARLSSNHDTESFLASKIANMDSELRQVTQAKELAEAQLLRERQRLLEDRNDLQAQVDGLQSELREADLKDKSISEAIETELSSKNSMHRRYEAMEKENQKCRAEVENMEQILRRKIESENSLANQVSTLASRLAESTASTCSSSNTFERRINTLMEEKATLQSKLDMLSVKVQSVLKTLGLMSKEHDRIIQLSTMHADTMETAQMHQESVAANAARNEQMMIDAAWEREEICRILTRQAKQVEVSSEERGKLMKEVKEQNVKMAEVKESRGKLTNSIRDQQGRMTSLMEDINVLKGFAVDDSHFFLDETLNASKISNDSDLDDSHLDSDIDVDVSKHTTGEGRGQDEGKEVEVEVNPHAYDSDDNDDEGLNLDESRSSDYDDSQISFDANSYGKGSGTIDYDEKDLISALTQSVDLIVVPTDDDDDESINSGTSQNDHDHGGNAFSLVEIESSVDQLCSEAARLVASMPQKEYP